MSALIPLEKAAKESNDPEQIRIALFRGEISSIVLDETGNLYEIPPSSWGSSDAIDLIRDGFGRVDLGQLTLIRSRNSGIAYSADSVVGSISVDEPAFQRWLKQNSRTASPPKRTKTNWVEVEKTLRRIGGEDGNDPALTESDRDLSIRVRRMMKRDGLKRGIPGDRALRGHISKFRAKGKLPPRKSKQ